MGVVSVSTLVFDTGVVFSEVDLNHNVAAIHCFRFIFEAFCLLALNKQYDV